MKDPVCGTDVKEGDRVVYRNKEYAFCCAMCRWAFEQDPNSFTN